ncbi:MAG: hypothetical protein A3E92_03450 [Candidatus Taylorbacteria bacterium RIFCSPHIGHO2_12_FULL_42_34]|nr:MAG: hypothetical protein A3E92_03450 [Candidatus Taylorbacteria bacterium RIFCSPHIGHO2_12_FULL_42_34]
MSSAFLFDYGISFKESGVIEIFPAAEIRTINRKGEPISLFLLIDSGASISALPKEDAFALGVEAENGTQVYVGGISNEAVRGWQHNLKVNICNQKITAPFIFLDNSNAPRILGRAIFFEKFSILFEEKNRLTGFFPANSKEAKSIKKIVDKI